MQESKGHTETRQAKGSLDFLKTRFRYLLVWWSVGARLAISLSLASRSGLVSSLNAHNVQYCLSTFAELLMRGRMKEVRPKA